VAGLAILGPSLGESFAGLVIVLMQTGGEALSGSRPGVPPAVRASRKTRRALRIALKEATRSTSRWTRWP
jgi:hypothetical protein